MRLNAKSLCVVAVALLWFCSCNKKDQTIGLGMLPTSDLLTTCVDSTSTQISFATITDDTVRSSLVTYMIGENSDPDFGNMRASFASRMYLRATVGDISDCKLDSVCFRLSRSTKYIHGNTNEPQMLSLYEVTHDITLSDCAAYNQKGSQPQCVNDLQKIMDVKLPAFNDTLKTYVYRLETGAATDIYNRLVACYDKDSSLQTIDSLFIKSFKGIYVSTQNNTFNGTNSVVAHCVPEISFYLKNKKDTTVVLTLMPSSQRYNETLPNDPSHVYLQAINVFEHQYSSEINLNTDSPKAYVQGGCGLQAKLNLKNVEIWRDSVMVINYAKLRIPLQKRPSWSEYIPLNLRVYDQKRNLLYSTLSNSTDSTYFEFNVQSILMQIHNETKPIESYSFELSVPENNAYANAFIVGGTNPKLLITYTK